MMKNRKTMGHLAALLTVLIWGTTFISTKVLLVEFQPIEILFLRFVMGFCILYIVYPKRWKVKNLKEELTYVAAGLCGICMYYLLENIALTFTMASNVGVITSAAPFFTAILAHIFARNEEKLQARFFVGFFIAMLGIICIGFHGSQLKLNPIGDVLAISAAFVWAIYSLLTKKIGSFGYPVVSSTRHTFFYGILFMIPAMFFFDFQLDWSCFSNIVYIGNILYLGMGASALCFVTWNFAVKELGAVRTSVYIYMMPVITLFTSAIILQEKLAGLSILGTVLTLAGLFLSEGRTKKQS